MHVRKGVNTAVSVVNAAPFLWTALRGVISCLVSLTLFTGATGPPNAYIVQDSSGRQSVPCGGDARDRLVFVTILHYIYRGAAAHSTLCRCP